MYWSCYNIWKFICNKFNVILNSGKGIEISDQEAKNRQIHLQSGTPSSQPPPMIPIWPTLISGLPYHPYPPTPGPPSDPIPSGHPNLVPHLVTPDLALYLDEMGVPLPMFVSNVTLHGLKSLCVDWSHLVCCPPWENNIFRLVWKTSKNSREATHLQRNIARLVTFVGWWVNLKNIGSGRDFFKVSYFSDTVTIYVKSHTGSKLNLQETKHFR